MAECTLFFSPVIISCTWPNVPPSREWVDSEMQSICQVIRDPPTGWGTEVRSGELRVWVWHKKKKNKANVGSGKGEGWWWVFPTRRAPLLLAAYCSFLETLHHTFQFHKGRKICEPPGDLGWRFSGLFLTFLPRHFIQERRRRSRRCFLWKAVDSSTLLIWSNIHRSLLTGVALLVLCLFRIIISRMDSKHLTSAVFP